MTGLGETSLDADWSVVRDDILGDPMGFSCSCVMIMYWGIRPRLVIHWLRAHLIFQYIWVLGIDVISRIGLDLPLSYLKDRILYSTHSYKYKS